jgi:hypothetical protein
MSGCVTNLLKASYVGHGDAVESGVKMRADNSLCNRQTNVMKGSER